MQLRKLYKAAVGRIWAGQQNEQCQKNYATSRVDIAVRGSIVMRQTSLLDPEVQSRHCTEIFASRFKRIEVYLKFWLRANGGGSLVVIDFSSGFLLTYIRAHKR